jgi:hypothetical protein
MKKLLVFTFVIVLLAIATDVLAQGCPMCKTSLEEARKNGSSVGNTLNSGILYLLALPYLIAATFGVIWFRNSRAKRKVSAIR